MKSPSERSTSNEQLCKRIAVYLRDRYEAGQYGQHVTLLRDALAVLERPALEPRVTYAEAMRQACSDEGIDQDTYLRAMVKRDQDQKRELARLNKQLDALRAAQPPSADGESIDLLDDLRKRLGVTKDPDL